MSGESERKRDAGRERGGAHAEAGHRHSVASGRAHPPEHDSHIATAKEAGQDKVEKISLGNVVAGREAHKPGC